MIRFDLTDSQTVSIANLANTLKGIACTEECRLWYDFGLTFPTMNAMSYRGDYRDCAIPWAEQWMRKPGPPYVSENLHSPVHPHVFADYLLDRVVNETFEGYKGGEYTMRGGTPLWVANTGDTTRTSIVGLVAEYDRLFPDEPQSKAYAVTLLTGYVP